MIKDQVDMQVRAPSYFEGGVIKDQLDGDLSDQNKTKEDWKD